jgi:hypothetical protein
MSSTLIILNLALSLFGALGVAGLTLLAHRLPSHTTFEPRSIAEPEDLTAKAA